MTPRVSIVMPTRNRASLLPRALASVYTQTLADWELILVDDGSQDHTPALLAEAKNDDARVRTLRTEGIGAAAARNRAIAVASAQYVAFLDDDDEWLPHKLERQLEVAAEDVLVHTAFIETRGPDARLAGLVDVERNTLRVLLRGNQLGNSTVLAPRSALEAVGGFDERLPRLQDWDLWLRLAARLRFWLLPQPLVRIHHTADSISTTSDALVRAADIMAGKLPDIASAAQLADGYFGLAHTLISRGQAAAGRAYIRRALRSRPWAPRWWVVALLAHLGTPAYRAATALDGRRKDDAR